MDCLVNYSYELRKDRSENNWDLDAVWGTWVGAMILFFTTFLVPFLLIYIGTYIRTRHEVSRSERGERDGEADFGQDSDWEDEEIPFVADMTDYLQNMAPGGYLDRFVEQQRRTLQTITRHRGMNNGFDVAVQTDPMPPPLVPGESALKEEETQPEQGAYTPKKPSKIKGKKVLKIGSSFEIAPKTAVSMKPPAQEEVHSKRNSSVNVSSKHPDDHTQPESTGFTQESSN